MQVEDAFPSAELMVTTAVPRPEAYILPSLSTVTTLSSEEDQISSLLEASAGSTSALKAAEDLYVSLSSEAFKLQEET